MKRTDQERIAREIGRKVKKDRLQEKRLGGKDDYSVGGYAKRLLSAFMYDDETVYNIGDDNVMEILREMKEDLTDKDCEAALNLDPDFQTAKELFEKTTLRAFKS